MPFLILLTLKWRYIQLQYKYKNNTRTSYVNDIINREQRFLANFCQVSDNSPPYKCIASFRTDCIGVTECSLSKNFIHHCWVTTVGLPLLGYHCWVTTVVFLVMQAYGRHIFRLYLVKNEAWHLSQKQQHSLQTKVKDCDQSLISRRD